LHHIQNCESCPVYASANQLTIKKVQSTQPIPATFQFVPKNLSLIEKARVGYAFIISKHFENNHESKSKPQSLTTKPFFYHSKSFLKADSAILASALALTILQFFIENKLFLKADSRDSATLASTLP
jgi:hypothetical protein